MPRSETGPARSALAGSGPFADRPARRLAAVAVGVCLLLAAWGAAVGWLVADRAGAGGTATAQVLVRPIEGNPFSTSGGDDLVNMETEAQLITSSAVAQLTTEQLGDGSGAVELRDSLTVVVPANTQLIEVTASGSDDAQAVRRAQAVVDTYLSFRADRAASDIEDRSSRLRDQIASREQDRRDLAGALSSVDGGSRRAIVLQQQVSDLTTELGEFRILLAQLDTAPTNPGQVVTPAAADEPWLLLRPGVLPLLGAIGGLLLGVAVVVGRRRLDERVHGPADLSHTGLAVLGRLPSEDGAHRARQVTAVRTALLAGLPGRPLVVAVGDPGSVDGSARGRGDDATTTRLVRDLVASLARAELGVALLDVAPAATGRAPARHLRLSTLVADGDGPRPRIAAHRTPGDPVVVVGDLATDELDDLSGSARMATLIGALRAEADVVVVRTGPVEDAAAQALVGRTDGVVLAVHEGRTSFAALEQSTERLSVLGTELAGLVCLARPGRGDDAPTGARHARPLANGAGADPAPSGDSADPAPSADAGHHDDPSAHPSGLRAGR